MKSDLTCPVEVVRVSIREEEPAQKPESGQEDGQIVCEIEFANLSEKETASIQMNIICFDADDARLGGRLVRATAEGEPRGRFTGVFMPEHVAGTARVEAAVEKVWFKDGVVWRREERNVREYTPNQLPEGRELDRLRAVAGPDAAGYAREDDIVWMCVCGRANRTSDDRCMRCRRERAQVLEKYSFAAIDSTVGRKERTLEEQTKKNLQKSSEQTVREVSREQKKLKKRHRRVKLVIALLVVVAAGLALLRWGLPYGANRAAAWKLEQGLAADAKALYDWVDAYWPDFGGAHMLAQQAEQVIVEGLIGANTDETLAEAARRAQALETQDADALYEKAVIARAQLAWDRGDTAGAETLLDGMTDSRDAQEMLAALRYEIGRTAMNRLDYKTAIAYFGLLGEYGDAQSLRSECIYRYGRQLMREGKYEEASAQLMLVPDESDALALVRQCRYAIALAAQEDGDYEAAAEAFESLGVYEEAETRAKVCRYEAGMAALSVGDLEKAAAQLEKAEDYEDAAQRWSDAVFTLAPRRSRRGAMPRRLPGWKSWSGPGTSPRRSTRRSMPTRRSWRRRAWPRRPPSSTARRATTGTPHRAPTSWSTPSPSRRWRMRRHPRSAGSSRWAATATRRTWRTPAAMRLRSSAMPTRSMRRPWRSLRRWAITRTRRRRPGAAAMPTPDSSMTTGSTRRQPRSTRRAAPT